MAAGDLLDQFRSRDGGWILYFLGQSAVKKMVAHIIMILAGGILLAFGALSALTDYSPTRQKTVYIQGPPTPTDFSIAEDGKSGILFFGDKGGIKFQLGGGDAER